MSCRVARTLLSAPTAELLQTRGQESPRYFPGNRLASRWSPAMMLLPTFFFGEWHEILQRFGFCDFDNFVCRGATGTVAIIDAADCQAGSRTQRQGQAEAGEFSRRNT